MPVFKKRLIYHILGVIVFLLLPVLISPRPAGEHLGTFTLPALRDLLAGVLMVSFFYFNYYVLVPKLFLKKQYVLYGLLVVLAFASIIFIPSYATGYSPLTNTRPPGVERPPAEITMNQEMPERLPGLGSGVPTPPNDRNFVLSISHNILLFSSVVLFSIFLRVQQRLFKTEQTKNQMELVSLKEQINPHFLFNVLNTIYGQAILSGANETANSILKLSGLLRHVVHEAQQPYIPLKKEVAYLENYMQLQQQRLGDGVELSYMIKGNVGENLKIAPLILVPFMENAFKHGINPDEKSSIEIEIALEDKKLFFRARNKKVNVDLPAHETSGAGLKITRSRLDLLYANAYELNIEDNAEEYQVQLQLTLND